MDVTIRHYVRKDSCSLRTAIDTVCGEGYWMRTPRFEPTPNWVHALQVPTCSQHCLLIAEERGRVVGWCRLFPIDNCSSGTRCIDVGIGLLPKYRDCQIGQFMLRTALQWASRQKVTLVTLTTRASNARAIHVFERCGFHRTTQPVDEWIEMICRLRPLGGYKDARSFVNV